MRFFTLSAAAAVALATTVSATTDIDTLNYALALEHLESAFYNQSLAKFTQTQFAASPYNYNDSAIYNNLLLIQQHENAHVSYLTTVIKSLGGTPIPACSSYNFGSALDTPATVITNAYNYETLGVEAYDGALNTLSNPLLQQGAATIATIEARHAAFLQQYAAPSDVPNASDKNNKYLSGAFDNAYNSSYVGSQVIGLLADGSCQPTTFPVARNLPGNYSTAVLTGTQTTLQQNDINALNYALFLEYFEAAFYAYYVGNTTNPGKFQASDFQTQDTATNQATGVTLARLQLIGAHEQAHVTFLAGALSSSAVKGCSGSSAYTFDSSLTASQFLAKAAVIENTGVSAYDGAINTITNPGYAQAAATIATVEARHADFLNTIATGISSQFTADNNKNDGTGGSFDSTLTPDKVVAAVKSLGYVPDACITNSGVVLPSTPTSTSTKNAAGQMAVNYGSMVAAGLVAAAAIMA